MIRYNRLAEYNAWIGNDTLAALINYEQNHVGYSKLDNNDSAIIICEEIARKYNQLGLHKDAAISLGAATRALVDIGNYKKAKEYMELYETKSGRFDSWGNIEHGREIYYKAKGLYYLNTNRQDSAEYYFRKELHDGKDFNNQHAGAVGLAMLYQRANRPDSVAKYYAYAYAMNDSVYAQTTTKDIERIQALYDYSRHQEVAHRESEKASIANKKFLISCIVLLTIFLIATWLYIALRSMIKTLKSMSVELEELKTERNKMLQHQSFNELAIAEKDKRIKQLEKTMRRYGKLIYFGSKKANLDLQSSENYKILKEKGSKGEEFSVSEWTIVKNLLSEYLPGYHDFISSRLETDSNEYKVCQLLRLRFEVKVIANALGVTSPYISKISSKVLKDIFSKKGSSKDLEKELLKIA